MLNECGIHLSLGVMGRHPPDMLCLRQEPSQTRHTRVAWAISPSLHLLSLANSSIYVSGLKAGIRHHTGSEQVHCSA